MDANPPIRKAHRMTKSWVRDSLTILKGSPVPKRKTIFANKNNDKLKTGTEKKTRMYVDSEQKPVCFCPFQFFFFSLTFFGSHFSCYTLGSDKTMVAITRIVELDEVDILDSSKIIEHVKDDGHRDVLLMPCRRTTGPEECDVSLLTGNVYGDEEVCNNEDEEDQIRLHTLKELHVVVDAVSSGTICKACIPLIKGKMLSFVEQVRNGWVYAADQDAIIQEYVFRFANDEISFFGSEELPQEEQEELFRGHEVNLSEIADNLLKEIEKSESFWDVWGFVRWNDHIFAFCSFNDEFKNLGRTGLFVIDSAMTTVVDFDFGPDYLPGSNFHIYPGNDCLIIVSNEICGWRVTKSTNT
jgi:hypothetical protein